LGVSRLFFLRSGEIALGINLEQYLEIIHDMLIFWKGNPSTHERSLCLIWLICEPLAFSLVVNSERLHRKISIIGGSVLKGLIREEQVNMMNETRSLICD
jgi:hypothetical protein